MPVPAVLLRQPVQHDARTLQDLAIAAGTLDVNSRYAYLLVCSHFAATSIVAESDGEVVGFVSGYRLPEHPDTLFVWQVAVASPRQGEGIALEMLAGLVQRLAPRGVRFVEATVSPDNAASRGLFLGLARQLSTGCTESQGYDPALFLPASHDAEPLLRIGPFSAAALRESQVVQKGTL
jgi:L-2,4-diaminobutyric acid acetyltransferase